MTGREKAQLVEEALVYRVHYWTAVPSEVTKGLGPPTGGPMQPCSSWREQDRVTFTGRLVTCQECQGRLGYPLP